VEDVQWNSAPIEEPVAEAVQPEQNAQQPTEEIPAVPCSLRIGNVVRAERDQIKKSQINQ